MSLFFSTYPPLLLFFLISFLATHRCTDFLWYKSYPYATFLVATLVVADGGERPEVGCLGVRHLGGVDGGDGQVVGPDDPEAPLVGDVADDALHAVGVDVAIKWSIDIKWISE